MFQYRKFGYVESSSLSFVFAYSTISLYICTGMFLVFRRNMNCSMTKSRILYRFVQSDTRETKRITISSASAVVKFSWSRSLPPNCNIAWCGRNSSIFASRRCRCDALFTQPPLTHTSSPDVNRPDWKSASRIYEDIPPNGSRASFPKTRISLFVCLRTFWWRSAQHSDRR